MSGTGTFQAANGKITDPDGNVFTAKGINLYDSQMGAASQIVAAFPEINFIRLNVYSYQDPSAYQSFVQTMTAKGVVVAFEDHTSSDGYNSGASRGVVYTGQQLQNELNWYSGMAKAYAGNSRVWFGTDNEPPEAGGSLSTWHQQTYNAIRATGNTNPVMIDPWGAYLTDGLDPSVYKPMSNIIIDDHYYGWYANYSTDQSAVSNGLTTIVNNTQSVIQGANGVAPVIIGEYGPSTDGVSTDANGNQVLTAVQSAAKSGQTSGAVAWGWNPGPNDNLTNGSGALTSFGQEVEGWFKSLPNLPQQPQEPQQPGGPKILTPTSGGSLTDAAGNVWTLTSGGDIDENGSAVSGGGGSIGLAYVNKTIYGEDGTSKQWYAYDNGNWTGPLAALPVQQTTMSTITLRVSEDAYQGDAKFTVSVDGTQVGGTMTASALHATGDSNVFVLTGNWGSGAHDVKLAFINDAYGGSATADRNLYVNSIGFNGTTYGGTTAAMMAGGSKDFSVGGAVAAGTPPADTLTLHLSEDAYNGNAQFTLLIDGKAITTAQDVTKLHSSGAWQDLSFAGTFGAGTHTVGVKFANDSYGGSAATDRNLYVNGVDCNGTHYGSGVTALMSNGTAAFTITTAH